MIGPETSAEPGETLVAMIVSKAFNVPFGRLKTPPPLVEVFPAIVLFATLNVVAEVL